MSVHDIRPRPPLQQQMDELRRELDAYKVHVADNMRKVAGVLELHAGMFEPLSRGLDAAVEQMATRADLDDLRLELRDAVATPFDAPRTVETDLLEDR